MHEMSLTESLVESCRGGSRKQGFSRVQRRPARRDRRAEPCRAGGVRFCFDAVARGTIVEGARLDIANVPGAGWCLDCGKTVALAERFGACPECGAHRVQMTARRRSAPHRTGGRLMCTVCGCGTSDVGRDKAPKARSQAHDHGHAMAIIIAMSMITGMTTTTIIDHP